MENLYRKMESRRRMGVELLCAFAILAFAPVLHAITEDVDGIQWTYNVVGDGATLAAPAIPQTSTGPVTIPLTLGNHPVTGIGDGAFYNCEGLTSVAIPGTVTSIGQSAFAWCTGLSSLTIPDSVTSIGVGAFAYCRGIGAFSVGAGNPRCAENRTGVSLGIKDAAP